LIQKVGNKTSKPSLSVVIPAYNEALSIGTLLEEILRLASQHGWEIIVVDDGSDDDTVQQVKPYLGEHFLRIIRHPFNRGYGAAIKTGIRASNAPLIATMDADGQHDPNDLLKLLSQSERHDLIVGSRPGLNHSKVWRMPGKWVLTRLAKYLIRQKIPDLNSGMRLFRAEAIGKYLHLCPDSFSFTTGFDTIVLILRLASLFQPLRIFIPASLSFIVMGVLWGLRYIILMQGVSVGAMLLILTGLLLFFFGLLTDQVAQLRLEKYE
jgi:glycosyltransferase involved in cell wall biosynthesis